MDTLNFTLDGVHFDYHHLLQLLKNKCEDYTIKLTRGVEIYSFTLKNYQLYLSPKYFSGNGSLSKFYQGNNLINMDYYHNSEALSLLEAEIGISLMEAKIKRLDFAFNIEMDHPVSNYLNIICPPAGYKDHSVAGETRDFRSRKKKSIVFYDKCNEPSSKKYLKYNGIAPFSCLRIESRLKIKPQELFGLKVLRFKLLFEKETYNTLLQHWYESYRSSPHVTNIAQTPVLYDSKTSFVNSLAMVGLIALGGVERMEQRVTSFPIHRRTKYNIRRYLAGLKLIVRSPLDLSLELNEKVDRIFYHYLAN